MHGLSQRFQRYKFWDAFCSQGWFPNPGLRLANAFGVKENQCYRNISVGLQPKHLGLTTLPEPNTFPAL